MMVNGAMPSEKLNLSLGDSPLMIGLLTIFIEPCGPVKLTTAVAGATPPPILTFTSDSPANALITVVNVVSFTFVMLLNPPLLVRKVIL